MFVGDEQLLDANFSAACARLADLTGDGLLGAASDDAFRGEMSRVGTALGVALRAPGLTQVQVQPLTARHGSAQLAVRWEIIGPDGGLFPVLDADLTLAAAGQHGTWLTLAGAYRPPGTPGTSHDRVAWQELAAATIRAFLQRIAAVIDNSAAPA